MKRVVVVSLVLLMGGLAHAGRILDTSVYKLTATPIDEAPTVRSPIGWSNMDLGGGVSSIDATDTCVGYEDYACDPAVWGSGTTFTLETFRFVGGVATLNDVIWFNFYDSNTTPGCDPSSCYDYIGVQPTQAGNWIWSLTLTTPRVIYTEGYVELDANYYGYGNDPPTGSWFMNDSGPTVGTSAAAPNAPYTMCFEFEGVPEPGGLLLLGAAGVLLRRR
jgi:hypothetical protein